jgi:deoxycytidylate deaminase
MKILKSGEEDYKSAVKYFDRAREEAKKSLCLRSKCGAVVVKKDYPIGVGFNSPPQNWKTDYCLKDSLPNDFKSNRDCCVHAEERAIINAIERWGFQEVKDSALYFLRLDLNNNPLYAEKPYCTICSKLALDNGISKWFLSHEFGFVEYGTEEYNKISFGLIEWNPKPLQPQNL